MENTLWERERSSIRQDSEEDWKSTAERLQRCVSLLLLKNQRLRVALLDAKRSLQESGRPIDLTKDGPP